jgi:hypothetical protein
MQALHSFYLIQRSIMMAVETTKKMRLNVSMRIVPKFRGFSSSGKVSKLCLALAFFSYSTLYSYLATVR